MKLVDCRDLTSDQLNNEAFDVVNFPEGRIEKDVKFLCPIGLEKLSLHGSFSSGDFEYFKIQILGCQAEPCKPKEEIAKKRISFAMIKTSTNTFAKNYEDLVEYSTDVTHDYFLDPTHGQTINMYFIESQMGIKDNQWDLLDVYEEHEERFVEFAHE